MRFVILALTMSAAVHAAAPSLSPADIEKATGLKGVHLVSATAPGSVPGRDNYADANGKIVLWFQSIPGPMFARAKAQPAKMMNGMEVEPKLYHGAVAGLGDEAFDSPDGKQQHALYVRKGDSAFGLISNVDRTGKPVVSMEQLKALANGILSRMQPSAAVAPGPSGEAPGPEPSVRARDARPTPNMRRPPGPR